MKTMMISELFTLRKSLKQLVATSALVSLLVGLYSAAPLTAAVMFAAMMPMMWLMNICAFDDIASWGSFRMSLPLSRRDVVLGRYGALLIVTCASALIGFAMGFATAALIPLLPFSSDTLSFSQMLADDLILSLVIGELCACIVVLLIAALVLPLTMKMGLTKAIRFIPLLSVVVFFGGLAALDSLDPSLLSSLLEGLVAMERSFGMASSDGFSFLGLLLLAAAAISLLIYAASTLPAMKFYAKRQL